MNDDITERARRLLNGADLWDDDTIAAVAALDAAGFDIVARQPDTRATMAATVRALGDHETRQPDTCPTCGCDCEQFGRCPDGWHDRGR